MLDQEIQACLINRKSDVSTLKKGDKEENKKSINIKTIIVVEKCSESIKKSLYSFFFNDKIHNFDGETDLMTLCLKGSSMNKRAIRLKSPRYVLFVRSLVAIKRLSERVFRLQR